MTTPSGRIKQERMAKSDPMYYIVSGAGSPEVDGMYIRDGEAIRNGSRVYKMSRDGEVCAAHSVYSPSRAAATLLHCGVDVQSALDGGFMLSHELVGGSEGFILGKAPRAW